MKKILLSVLIAAICTISADCKSVKGSVKDARGKGISGVVVSDGLNTAVTNGGGRFKLEVNDDSRFVFISTPSGYVSKTLKGAECFFKELEDGVKSYDFVVTQNKKDDTNHNVIVIADPQISERSELEELKPYATDIEDFVIKSDGDYTFGLCLGDIVGWDHTIYNDYNKIMAGTKIDFRHVIGNHDMTNYGRSHETSMKDYENMYGPAWYSFNVGKVHYIVLNDNYYVGRDYFYIGLIDERQLRWLENDLSYVPAGSTVVLAMHIPTTLGQEDRDAFQYGTIGDNLANKTALYAMLEPYKALILSGHMHTSDFQKISDNITEINIAGLCGAWWCGATCIDGTPAGYKAFDFNGDNIKWIYKGCGHKTEYQFNAYVDPDQPGHIVANVWDYDPAWKVEYYEDGKKVCDMEQFTGTDMRARELYKDPSSLKRNWVYAAQTSHLFKAPMTKGARKLEVKVTDRFGRTYSKTIHYELPN